MRAHISQLVCFADPDNWAIQAYEFDWVNQNFIADRASIAHAQNKPFIIEETGMQVSSAPLSWCSPHTDEWHLDSKRSIQILPVSHVSPDYDCMLHRASCGSRKSNPLRCHAWLVSIWMHGRLHFICTSVLAYTDYHV